MTTQHTPGPWRFEFNAEHRSVHLVGGRPRFDLTIMDFCRCGMGGATMLLRDTAHDGMNIMHKLHDRPDWIAPEPGREHHKDWHQLVTHPDIRLIEAAPDLLEALKKMNRAYVNMLETGRDRVTMLGGQCDPVAVMEANDPNLREARAAIAKAEGGAI